MEVQKEVVCVIYLIKIFVFFYFILKIKDEVDKDLLSHELEQANQKLNWYNDKFKEYSDLQINNDLLITKIKQLENNLELQQLNSKENNQEQEQQSIYLNYLFLFYLFYILAENNNDDLNRLLIEERQRCDALVNDNDSMLRLLEENHLNENNLKEDIKNKEKQIDQLYSQINYLQDQLQIEV